MAGLECRAWGQKMASIPIGCPGLNSTTDLHLTNHNSAPCLMQHMADLCPRDQARVNGFLDDVLSTWGHQVEAGHNPEVAYMSWMWEDLRVYQ